MPKRRAAIGLGCRIVVHDLAQLHQIELRLHGEQRGPVDRVEPGNFGNDFHLAVTLDRRAVMRRLRSVDHHAGERKSAPADRLERQQRVIDGAERRAGDENDRQMQLGGQVDDVGRVGQRHQSPTCALDHQAAGR